MAVINATTIGAAKKSLGEQTYKRVRGRTIGSRRITENTSKTTLQISQRGKFGRFAKIAKTLSVWIDLVCDKTKYGSQRNNFVHQNAPVLAAMSKALQGLTDHTPLKDMLYILSQMSEQSIPFVSSSGAALISFITECDQNLRCVRISVASSRTLRVGDIIRVLLAAPYIMPDFSQTSLDNVSIIEHTLTDADLATLSDPNHITLSPILMPELGEIGSLFPVGSELTKAIVSVSVEQSKQLSSSVFAVIEDVPMSMTTVTLDMTVACAGVTDCDKPHAV